MTKQRTRVLVSVVTACLLILLKTVLSEARQTEARSGPPATPARESAPSDDLKIENETKISGANVRTFQIAWTDFQHFNASLRRKHHLKPVDLSITDYDIIIRNFSPDKYHNFKITGIDIMPHSTFVRKKDGTVSIVRPPVGMEYLYRTSDNIFLHATIDQ